MAPQGRLSAAEIESLLPAPSTGRTFPIGATPVGGGDRLGCPADWNAQYRGPTTTPAPVRHRRSSTSTCSCGASNSASPRIIEAWKREGPGVG